MNKLLLFLGAGASKPLGIPTMVEMVGEIESQLENDEAELFSTIRKAIARRGIDTDIEAILSVVQAIARGASALELGYPAMYLVKEVLDGDTRGTLSAGRREEKVAAHLVETIQGRVRELCSPTDLQNREPRLFEPYTDLFARLLKIPGVNSLDLGDGTKAPAVTMVTTNYDLAVETYFQEHRFKIPDLFDSGSVGTPKLPPAGIVGTGHQLKLVKLHGSLNWFLLEGGEVVQDPVGPGHIAGRRNLGHMLLYPIQQKDLYLYPWMDLFWVYRRDLRDTENWVFIGYRFGDEYLTAITREALRDTPRARAFIFGPRAKEGRECLVGNERNLETRVEAVRGYFGKTEDHEDLVSAISPAGK